MSAHRFSSRLPSLAENRWSAAVADARARGPVFDLTESNPTAVALDGDDDDAAWQALGSERRYQPDPQGAAVARGAIADWSARTLGAVISPDDLVLCASTSEAYSWLFKLICDPGDSVLVPRPSYPLFELLARLDAVDTDSYPLRYERGWFLDVAELDAAISARTRAVVAVSPNNPTGTLFAAADAAHVAARGLPLIVDEVFAPYAARVAAPTAGLRFSLGGLSKAAGLPQLKLAWIHISGPRDKAAEARERLLTIADQYLSVSTPVQAAAAVILAPNGLADRRRAAIAARLDGNRAHLTAAVAHRPLDLLDGAGCWSAILRLPAVCSEDEWVIRSLGDQVVVQPGYFYEMSGGPFVVVSLLTEPAVFAEGAARLIARCEGELR